MYGFNEDSEPFMIYMQSKAERSNRLFDFSCLRTAMFMVCEAFSESGSNLLLFCVVSPFMIDLSEARWADALLVKQNTC